MHTLVHVLRPVSGGMLRHWQALASRAQEYGFRTLVFSSSHNDFSLLIPFAEAVREIPLTGGINPWFDLLSARKISRYVQEAHPDIIHFHGFKAALIGALPGIKIPVPEVYTVHNYFPGGVKGFSTVYPILERRIAQKMDAVICVSGHLAKYLSTIPNYPLHLLNIIYNGIDLEKFRFSFTERDQLREQIRTKLGWKKGDFLILTVARLIPAKGLETLLEAVELLAPGWPELRVAIAGTGPEKEKYEELISLINRSVGVKIVQLLGNVPELAPYYAAADLFVLPSWSEGLPLSLLEAQASLVPVIATTVGGIPEVVAQKETGLLVKPEDPAQLGEAMLLIKDEPELAKTMANRALSRVQKEFSVHQMVEDTYRLYQNLLHRSNRYAGL